MYRLTVFCCGALIVVASTMPASGQADRLAPLLTRGQLDLAADGREFLINRARRRA